jgi:hypothetical protein
MNIILDTKLRKEISLQYLIKQKKNPVGQEIRENSEFVVSGLVAGSSEQME